MDRIDVLVENLNSKDLTVAKEAALVCRSLFRAVRKPTELGTLRKLRPNHDVVSTPSRQEKDRLVLALLQYVQFPVIEGLRPTLLDLLGETGSSSAKQVLKILLLRELESPLPQSALVRRMCGALSRLGEDTLTDKLASPDDPEAILAQATAYLAGLGVFVEKSGVVVDEGTVETLCPLPRVALEAGGLQVRFDGETLTVRFVICAEGEPDPCGFVFHRVRRFRRVDPRYVAGEPLSEDVPAALLLKEVSLWAHSTPSDASLIDGRRLYHFEFPWLGRMFEVMAEGWSPLGGEGPKDVR